MNREHQPEEHLGSGMNEYAKKLEEFNPSLARRFDKTRMERFKAVESLHLPGQKVVSVRLEDFVLNPDQYLNQIPSELFYVNVGQIRERGLTRDQARMFIEKNSSDKSPDLEILLAEYYTNVYGGNIIVRPDQSVVVEFKKGSQGPISTGTATPEYRIERDATTHVFRYSFEDEGLRKMMYGTVIKTLPHDGGLIAPGYYEFQLVHRTPQGPLEPVFIDYDSDPAYTSNAPVEPE